MAFSSVIDQQPAFKRGMDLLGFTLPKPMDFVALVGLIEIADFMEARFAGVSLVYDLNEIKLFSGQDYFRLRHASGGAYLSVLADGKACDLSSSGDIQNILKKCFFEMSVSEEDLSKRHGGNLIVKFLGLAQKELIPKFDKGFPHLLSRSLRFFSSLGDEAHPEITAGCYGELELIFDESRLLLRVRKRVSDDSSEQVSLVSLPLTSLAGGSFGLFQKGEVSGVFETYKKHGVSVAARKKARALLDVSRCKTMDYDALMPNLDLMVTKDKNKADDWF